MIASSPRLIARDALAEFIRDAAKSINEAYWFVVCGECDVSLCTHTLLSPEEYTEVLYHAELISLGKHGYAYSEDTWRGFLRDYALFGHGELGVSEVNKYRAFTHKLKTPGSTIYISSQEDCSHEGQHKSELHVIHKRVTLICIDPLSSSDHINVQSSVNVTITNDRKRCPHSSENDV